MEAASQGARSAAAVDAGRLLIVDDERPNVVLLERILHRAGLEQTVSVTDPRDAVRACRDHDPDLVLLDLHMPHIDGFGIIEALGRSLPDDAFLPIVVLTADSTIETRDRALRAGASDFLTKPFDHTEVVLRVRNLLRTRSLYTEVQRHNAGLRADLARRVAQEQALLADQAMRRARIDQVLTDHALMMHFQPIANLVTGEVVGLEALARFDCEPRRPPDEWFADATAVGRGSLLEIAAAEAAVAHLDGLPPDAFLAVNVSPMAAVEEGLANLLLDLPADRIVLELTEHARIDNYGAVLRALAPLRERGVRIAVDDAGAGYSSLRHILQLRPDILKLDLALTRDIDNDPARRSLAMAMVSFASEIGATVVAEGIETTEEFRTLRALNVPCGQGYRLARPAPIADLSAELDLSAFN